jgi:ElaB/YqjD/DUF883 family membrane-anchored ribosome-binding protein
MKTSKIYKEAQEISGDTYKKYDKLEFDAKTLAYSLEEIMNASGRPADATASALYKKADALLNALQKGKKKLINVMDEVRPR